MQLQILQVVLFAEIHDVSKLQSADGQVKLIMIQVHDYEYDRSTVRERRDDNAIPLIKTSTNAVT